MSMLMSIAKYITIILAFILIDAPYLYLNRNLYTGKVKAISGDSNFTTRYYSALMVYIALALGMLVLVLPRIRSGTTSDILVDSIIYGGIFGIASYATFDFTIHLMFKEWDLGVSVMDTLWGSVLCTLVAFVISYLWNKY
jgi:uncharacterized membrane protein